MVFFSGLLNCSCPSVGALDQRNKINPYKFIYVEQTYTEGNRGIQGTNHIILNPTGTIQFMQAGVKVQLYFPFSVIQFLNMVNTMISSSIFIICYAYFPANVHINPLPQISLHLSFPFSFFLSLSLSFSLSLSLSLCLSIFLSPL